MKDDKLLTLYCIYFLCTVNIVYVCEQYNYKLFAKLIIFQLTVANFFLINQNYNWLVILLIIRIRTFRSSAISN